MKRYLKKISDFTALFGFDMRNTVKTVKGLPFYIRDLWVIKHQQRKSKLLFPFGKYYPCLEDKFDESGTSKGHYFHQDLLVARKIFKNNPLIHVDVGSRFDGLVSHIASFRHIQVLDIRPMKNNIPNVDFVQCDLMGNVPDSMVNYYDSLSCLHALEHFGLGRYSDKINFEGYLIGFYNLCKILKPKGKFYFSVPIGPQRIEFNAHRVFSIQYLLELIKDKFHIDSFSFVDDKGDLFEDIELTQDKIYNNCSCHYGCGIFEMTKEEG